MGSKTHERVVFRLIQMPCCGQAVCWINPRYPNYCPECGANVMATVKSCVAMSSDQAVLTIKED